MSETKRVTCSDCLAMQDECKEAQKLWAYATAVYNAEGYSEQYVNARARYERHRYGKRPLHWTEMMESSAGV